MEKKKAFLQTETERLISESMDVKKRLNKEIRELKLQRGKLLSQIKSFTSTLLLSKGHQEKVARGLEEFGSDHVAFLNSISHALQLDVRNTTANLVKKSGEITEQEEFLTDLSTYLMEYALICEAEASHNALQEEINDRVGKQTSLTQREAFIVQEKAQATLSEAELKLSQAEERFKKADTLAKKLDTSFEDEKIRLSKWLKELLYRERAVLSEREALHAKEKDLKELLRLINDKDAAFNRKIKELKKHGII